jgi:hypothetical protein
MAINGSIGRSSRLGPVTVGATTGTTVANLNFKPKPNVALAEIIDVSTVGVEDGYALIYNSDTEKYEAQAISNVAINITNITGGTF